MKATTAENLKDNEITCQNCSIHESKYKCPGCGMRTCSLPCIKQHRENTGIVCHTNYKQIGTSPDDNIRENPQLHLTWQCQTQLIKYNKSIIQCSLSKVRGHAATFQGASVKEAEQPQSSLATLVRSSCWQTFGSWRRSSGSLMLQSAGSHRDFQADCHHCCRSFAVR